VSRPVGCDAGGRERCRLAGNFSDVVVSPRPVVVANAEAIARRGGGKWRGDSATTNMEL
jgi:hypothetical protein